MPRVRAVWVRLNPLFFRVVSITCFSISLRDVSPERKRDVSSVFDSRIKFDWSMEGSFNLIEAIEA